MPSPPAHNTGRPLRIGVNTPRNQPRRLPHRSVTTPAALPQLRILLIDDSKSDVELLVMAFGREGIIHPLDVVPTGREAIAYLAAADPLPALVLLDLKLPDVPGFELLRIFRGDPKLKDLPLIVLTGTKTRVISTAPTNWAPVPT